jgi:amino acid transporter
VSPEWLAAQSFLAQSSTYTGESMSWIFQYILLLAPSLVLAVFLFLAWMITLISLLQIFLYFISRIMLAWADDGLLFEGMDYVHPRFRSPLLTLLVVAILAMGGLVDTLLGGWLYSRMSLMVFGGLGLLPAVVAITFMPFLRKRWFQAAPGWVQARLGPLPVVTVLGLPMMVYLLWLVVSGFYMPGGPIPSNLSSLLVYAVLFTSGLVWYSFRRTVLRRRKTRLEDRFNNLPDVR